MNSLQIKTKDGELFFEKYTYLEIFYDNIPVPNNDIINEEWPEIIYNIKNNTGTTSSFYVNPATYVEQYNNKTKSVGITIFEQPDNIPNWNILGLVFLSQNYVVFDYANQLVKIAPKK